MECETILLPYRSFSQLLLFALLLIMSVPPIQACFGVEKMNIKLFSKLQQCAAHFKAPPLACTHTVKDRASVRGSEAAIKCVHGIQGNGEFLMF